MQPPEKRPRQYAQDILRLRTAAERRDALASVPPHLQAMTAHHVTQAMRQHRTRASSPSPSPAPPAARDDTACAS